MESAPTGAAIVPGTSVDLGPDGTTFDPPATLTLRYDETLIPAGVAEASLRIHEVTSTGLVELPGGVVDTVANTVTALVHHFTDYTIGGGVQPTKLRIDVQPDTTPNHMAILPGIQVAAVDDSGTVATGFDGEIVLSFGANPSNASLSGVISVDAIAGVATFSNVSIDSLGTGYTITATATDPDLAPATTVPFAVIPFWEAQTSNTTANLEAVWVVSPIDVFAVGNRSVWNGTFSENTSVVMHYDGVEWSEQHSEVLGGGVAQLHGVWASGSNDAYAIGDGVILRYDGSWTVERQTSFGLGQAGGLHGLVSGSFDQMTGTDIAVAAGNGVALFSGNGSGDFSNASLIPMAAGADDIAAADLNGDGKLDLVTVSYAAVSVLLQSTGFPSVVEYAGGGSALTIGDVNGDADLDVVVVGRISTNVRVFLGDGSGGLGTAMTFTTGLNPRDVEIAELGGDTFPDVIIATRGEQGVSVMYGDGTGAFTAPFQVVATAGSPVSLTVADFDGDGFQDVASVSEQLSDDTPATVSVLMGDSVGNLMASTNPAPQVEWPVTIISDDATGEGDVDLIVLTQDGASVFSGSGNGTFGQENSIGLADASGGGGGIGLVDVTGDGVKDLVATAAMLTVGRGLGGGDFEPTPSLAIWGTGPSEVFASGFGGAFLHSDGSGNWGPQPAPHVFQINALWGPSPTDVFAVGWPGVVFHYNGSSWSEFASGLSGGDLTGVWGNSASSVYVTGGPDQAVLHYDSGIWAADEIPGQSPDIYVPQDARPRSLFGIWGNSPTSVFAVGESWNNGLIILHYDGLSWETQLPGKPFGRTNGRGIHGDATSGTVFAVGDRGEIVRGSR